jgi:CrcB protein
METLCVMIGGALGSSARYFLGKQFSSVEQKIPVNTMLINISGALLLGFISQCHLLAYQYNLLAEGFLGAYTTFSTFMFEDYILFENNRQLSAIIYLVGTIALGFIGYYLGMLLAALGKIPI